MAKMCIICGNESPEGHVIENTSTIEFIRKIKKRLNLASNNELVVCEADLETHAKKRKSFEQKLMLHIAGGSLLLVISIALPLMSSRPIEFVSVFMILLLALFLVGLAMLSYIPPVAKKSAGAEHKSLADVKKEDSHTHKRTTSKKSHAKSHGKKRG